MRRTLLLVLSAASMAIPGLAQNYQGNLDGVACGNIYGWAWTNPNSPASVDLYDSAILVESNIPANVYRGDLQAAGYDNGYHGFSITPPAALLDHRLHQVYVKFSGTQINVGSTPKAMQCASSSQGYTY